LEVPEYGAGIVTIIATIVIVLGGRLGEVAKVWRGWVGAWRALPHDPPS
jgi:hypothetical protein